MKKLEYEILINAPAEKVWNCMLNEDSYQEWTQVSWPNSFYQGSWQQGEKIRFIGANGAGTLALVKRLILHEYVGLEHIAVLLPGGIEHTESEEAKGWMGTQENYTFTTKGNTTLLGIEMITSPAWEKMFNDGWPGALTKLKEICERE